MDVKDLFSISELHSAITAALVAQNYREWLKSKGYNVKCKHFDAVGGIRCTLCKPLILCNGRCIHKTN